jgi:hypothetical protein
VTFIYGFILIGWALAVGYAVRRNRVKAEEEISIEKRRA